MSTTPLSAPATCPIDTGASQRVPLNNHDEDICLPVEDSNVNQTTQKHRFTDRYFNLSPHEFKRLSNQTTKKIGMIIIDHSDTSDSIDGKIVSIVKHKRSRKLCYKYYDYREHEKPPKDPKQFDYIPISYALINCKFSKATSLMQFIAASVLEDQNSRNYGHPNPKRRKQKKQRQRPRLEWYQKLSLTAASAQMQVAAQLVDHLFAYSAIDLNEDGTRLTSTSSLKGPDRERWLAAHGEEIDRLIQSSTGTFVSRSSVPKEKTIAYYNPQLKIKIKNGEVVYRVRGTIGGDQLPFAGNSTAYTAALETIRLLLNAIASEGANMMTLDIKDFYLGTPLAESVYMRISLKHIPEEQQHKYRLDNLAHNGYVIMKIDKSIYGLKEAGKLSQDRLVMQLAKYGYNQCIHTPCLFLHESNGTAFTLVVDDFLVKYRDSAAATHLIACLQELYTITTDFAETQKYIGITMQYDKVKKTIKLSMPGYVEKALKRFNCTHLRGVDSPMIYVPPTYGAHQQEIFPDKPSQPLSPDQLQELQEIVGVFLYYARAVDPLMLTAINKIGSRQSKATTLIRAEIDRFLQYATKWPNSVLCIKASNMKLHVHSDASYLSELDARSRAGAFLYLGDHEDGTVPNAPVSYLSVIISSVVDSATAAEYAALFIAAQNATPIRTALGKLGYLQDVTEIICDNLCAVGIANNSFKQKRSKTIDMRYHWIRDQVKINNFSVTWKPGVDNLADFFTKAHPVHHHLAIMHNYVAMEEGVLE